MQIFAAGIGHVVRRRPGFFDSRNHLTPDGIVGAVCGQKVKKMWRHGQREFVTGQQNATAFLIAQFQMFLKVTEANDPVLELPFPIIPEFRRHVRPVTWSVRHEVFSVPTHRGKSIHFWLWAKKLRPVKIVSMQAPGRALRT
jgi:hypothetical protein